MPLDAERPQDDPEREAEALEDGPLLDVQLEVGGCGIELGARCQRGVEIDAVRQAAATFSLPALDPWQQTVLQRALRFVGSPYVWAGTSERDQQLGGKLFPGGFDCSGLVWRVYKLEPFAGAPALSTVLKGRTTYAMSGEVPRSKRVPRDALRPADVVFFGSNGPRSKPAEVGHMGIYLGNGWMVHSSDRGTTLVPMTGWYETRFAWGRSPLAEAGLGL